MRFWRKTISGFTSTLKREFTASESADRNGFLQKADPRIKLVAALVLVVVTTLLHSISMICLSLLLTLLTAWLSKVTLRAYFGSLVPVTLLTTLLAVPSALSIITPGSPIISAWGVAITDHGLYTAARFATGAVACVAWMSLLTLTTRWTTLLAALQSLRIPAVFVLTLQMMYRFLFVLVRDAEQVHLAKESRMLTAERAASGRSWVAGRAGDLFIRSRRLSYQVHMSMVSRGFTGEARSLQRFNVDVRSLLMLTAAVALAAFLMYVESLG